jgi:hypothetical protein
MNNERKISRLEVILKPTIFREHVILQRRYLSRNIEARSRNHFCHGKAISITYFCVCVCVCVCVALVIQHVKRMHRIILSFVATPARPLHISLHYLTKDRIFGKKVMEHKMCALIFYTTIIGNISHLKNNPERYYHKLKSLQVKYPLFLLVFNETKFVDRFSKKEQI